MARATATFPFATVLVAVLSVFAPDALAAAPVAGAPAPPAAQAGMEVTIDPRIELVAAVSYLAGDRAGWTPRSDSPYRTAMMRWADRHRRHPAVARLRAIEGFAYSYPAEAILAYGPPPALAPISPPSAQTLEAIGGQAALEAWVQSLRDFARDTRYMDFFDRQRPEFARMIERTRAKAASTDIVAPFERFYGLPPQRYTLILAPNILAGAFGPSVPLPDGRRHFYTVQGAAGVVDGVPDFGDPASIASLSWHEFGHTVVNPLDAAHAEALKASAPLYETIADEMHALAYTTWEIAVNEALVRANTLHLCRTVFAGEAANTCLESQLTPSVRFNFHVYRIADFRIGYYERRRDRWPTYADFHPVDLKVLELLAQSK